jgi:hypothetical protein
MKYVTFNTVNFGTIEISRSGKTFAGDAFFQKQEYASDISDDGVFYDQYGTEFTVRYNKGNGHAVLEVATSKIIGEQEMAN